jgi:alpha-methylacyl-CoA racemase
MTRLDQEMRMSLKPLSGIRVLDLTSLPPGGFSTVVLADLGAEIIRVESPAQKGKRSLVIGQVALSRGKRSMTLDLRNPQSIKVLQRLLPSVDVLVENAKPGAMEARGFGYSHAQVCNPKIIWCALTGFGQSGPYAEHAGHDLSFLAHSGLLAGLSTELPWHPAMTLALQAGALAAVIAIQAALLQRAQSGHGTFLDISLSEAAGWLLTCGINPLSASPFSLPVTPDRRLYVCSDGRFVAVACAEPRTWEALCAGLNVPELKDALHKAERAAVVTDTLAELFRTRTAKEWVERLAPSGAAVTIVNRGIDLLDDPHALARGSVMQCAGVSVPANPVRLSSIDGERNEPALSAPPTVGADTADVLAAAGFSTEEVSDLVRSGVI